MSNQMHVIYSKTIKGAGMVAGGPYFNGKIYNETRTAEQLAENSLNGIDRFERNS